MIVKNVKVPNLKWMPCHCITHNFITSSIYSMKTSHHWRSIGKWMKICSMMKASMIGWNKWPRFSHNMSSWLWSIGFGICLFVLLGFLYALAPYTLGSPPLTKYIQTKNSRAQSESKQRRKMVSQYHFTIGRTTQFMSNLNANLNFTPHLDTL